MITLVVVVFYFHVIFIHLFILVCMYLIISLSYSCLHTVYAQISHVTSQLNWAHKAACSNKKDTECFKCFLFLFYLDVVDNTQCVDVWLEKNPSLTKVNGGKYHLLISDPVIFSYMALVHCKKKIRHDVTFWETATDISLHVFNGLDWTGLCSMIGKYNNIVISRAIYCHFSAHDYICDWFDYWI